MSKRTVIARALFHIERGFVLRNAYYKKHGIDRTGLDWKDTSEDLARFVLDSAQGDEKAYALLVAAGVDPLTPRRSDRAIHALLDRA